MKNIDFDVLIDGVVASDPDMVADFTDAMAEILPRWLREFRLSEAEVTSETPGCLLSLILLIVERRAEIQSGRVLLWLRKESRNLTVRFWRELDEKSSPPALLTAGRARRALVGLTGSRRSYHRAARQLGVPADWLRRSHREVQARFTEPENF